MDEATREQQREARRKRVLDRSRGERPPIVDLATQQKEIAPEGVTAELVDPTDGDTIATPEDPSSSSADQSGKSASRLAAERRRRRILESKKERMAKVHGGRAVRGGEGVDEGTGDQDAKEGGKESLDDVSSEVVRRRAQLHLRAACVVSRWEGYLLVYGALLYSMNVRFLVDSLLQVCYGRDGLVYNILETEKCYLGLVHWAVDYEIELPPPS